MEQLIQDNTYKSTVDAVLENNRVYQHAFS